MSKPQKPQPQAINIPKPCHENWDNMQPNSNGRHCNSCQKTVVDFTMMSDQEILQYMTRAKQAGAKVCGRTLSHQLGRRLLVPDAPLVRNGWSGWRWLLATAVITTDTVAIHKGVEDHSLEQFQYRRYMMANDRVTMGMMVAPIHEKVLGDTTLIALDSVPVGPISCKGTPDIDFVTPPTIVGELAVEPMPVDTLPESVLTGVIDIRPHDTLTTPSDPVPAKSWPNTLRRILVDTLRTLRILPNDINTTSEPLMTTNTPRPLPQTETPNLYPNPVTRGGSFHITWQTPAGDYQLALYNSSGSLIQSKFIQLPNPILTVDWSVPSTISTGIYFLHIVSHDQKQTVKIMID